MIAAFLPLLGTLIDKLLPDAEKANEAKIKLLEMAQRGELAEIDAQTKLAAGQLDVNKSEAESGNKMAATWRPMIGWVCAVALAYNYLVHPLLPWILQVCGVHAPPLPDVKNEELMTLMFGMLGLGGLRTYEKTKGLKR